MSDDIVAEGAEIIWVLEQNRQGQAGNANRCMDSMDKFGDPSVGWCVGDGQTEPVAGTFDNSPFSVERGFDIIVRRDTMEIMYSTSHGTEPGNENPSGAEILAEVQAAIAAL
ncbi:MAG: hypothetical protein KTR31_00825 [Myxococcales bacterium]|nr:hypothetical protein [Myxococcales bacterium]